MNNNKKQLTGLVLSDSMNKTVIITVTRRFPHPQYKKYVQSSKKYYAHDENNTFKKGDIVELLANKPLSKLKRWRTSKLVKNGNK